jgi:DNA-binding CsgD family transcriptional regulator
MKLKDILPKYQNYLLGIALVLSSIAISIRGSNGEVKLVLHNYPFLITLLVTVSLLLVALYFQINRKKISSLSRQIKEQSQDNSEEFNVLMDGLTTRQKEVYDLIISGKSNKEIMAELFIEQSMLKTHINHIYKKLNIKGRRELKSNLSR